MPLFFKNGEAFQFYWSKEGLLVGGLFYKAQVSPMKLCEVPSVFRLPRVAFTLLRLDANRRVQRVKRPSALHSIAE